MKKRVILLQLLFVLLVSIQAKPVVAAEADTGVCGKSYMLTVDHELYLMKFSSSSFGPDCSGSAVFVTSSGPPCHWNDI
jgi:hypothetical protein